ncbi:MAG: four helix bundle protein [Muribaculaceae bacterium]|nr:four helix bundle protein [Muribaculaceae bacterium]
MNDNDQDNPQYLGDGEKKEENAVKEKSFAFAVRCVKLYVYLKEQKREYDMSRQLLRCGTSIGANVREGLYAQSRADFLAKMSIAKKEAAESEYWLELLEAGGILTVEETQSMLKHCRELVKLLITICRSTGPRLF